MSKILFILYKIQFENDDLGCFHFLGSVNIHEHLFVWTYFRDFLNKYLRVEWMGYVVNVC